MSPDDLSQVANPLALLGWIALAASPFMPRAADLLAGLIIPVLLSLGYAALILVHWSGATGGFGSHAEVMALFTKAPIALAGWLHYLAFDLVMGAWATRRARADAIAHLLVMPHLALIFLFGPLGFLTFHIMRLAFGQRPQTA